MKNNIKLFVTKKNIKTIIIVVFLLFLSLYVFIYIKNTQKRQIKKASELYEKAYQLYFSGEGLVYSKDKDNQEIHIERSNGNLVNWYYKIDNYDDYVNKLFSSKGKSLADNFLEVYKQNDDIYIKEIGRGISGYFGTTFTVSYYSKNKIKFKAHSKFCEVSHQINGLCEDEKYYYTINKPFVLVKENGKWKIDEFTSIFEFSNDEIK